VTLPSKFNTCKFQDGRFTAKIHYLQIQLLANSHSYTAVYFRISINRSFVFISAVRQRFLWQSPEVFCRVQILGTHYTFN